ncbi:spore gernimation protein GerPD [Priestia koreensis]|uniref:Spore gernimation protein GerPD n=1 Tax=Priestia koreensis TaxID=284581 RepID=A0A0M0LGP3_9BACI|nr:spore gernimation protein GerPD [Priestia koreensis]KOO50255.1 spore gernimation protein GerPD [Priestia koreensis]MCM3004805.1 spore gernimation protein GerPD [Priestia koreensis]UNL85604.1 spore gernimation protein GerPD [Priestia koreensis]
MNYTVINRDLLVGDIKITGVSSSSIFLIGDAHYVNLSATFDTPAESLIIGPYVPLSLT